MSNKGISLFLCLRLQNPHPSHIGLGCQHCGHLAGLFVKMQRISHIHSCSWVGFDVCVQDASPFVSRRNSYSSGPLALLSPPMSPRTMEDYKVIDWLTELCQETVFCISPYLAKIRVSPRTTQHLALHFPTSGSCLISPGFLVSTKSRS